MSVKTVRFNKKEEVLLKKILVYYSTDFSSCVKELIEEKLEDLADIGHIKRFRESARDDYLSAKEIDIMFHDEAA